MQILEAISTETKLANRLAKINLHTHWDLALHIPLRYEDLTKVYPIVEVKVGQQVMVEGKIIGHELVHKKTKQLLVRIDDGTAIITLLFFHFYPSYASQYANGKLIRAHGEIKADYYGNKTIIHPKIQSVTSESRVSNTFSPIYPTTNGLANNVLVKLIEDLFVADIIPETLPQAILTKYKLPNLPSSLLSLHKLTPEQYANNHQAQALRRLKYDELIAQQLLMQNLYLKKKHKSAPKLYPSNQYIQALLGKLPFSLTKAQQKVLAEIKHDLAQDQQMNRLLQGDVGSGKTIVAAIACLIAIENGYQACLMAPTEILAEQHYLKLDALLKPLGINVAWLSGSLTAKQNAKFMQYVLMAVQLLPLEPMLFFRKMLNLKIWH